MFHTFLVYFLQQDLEMPHWCFGCISIGFDVRVGYVSMHHLTEPVPYTGQVLSPALGHILSVMGHILLSPQVIQCPWNVSFQFVQLILVNYNVVLKNDRQV